VAVHRRKKIDHSASESKVSVEATVAVYR